MKKLILIAIVVALSNVAFGKDKEEKEDKKTGEVTEFKCEEILGSAFRDETKSGLLAVAVAANKDGKGAQSAR